MNKYISIITILGLFILLFLQSVWLYNSYISTKKEIIIKISDVGSSLTIRCKVAY